MSVEAGRQKRNGAYLLSVPDRPLYPARLTSWPDVPRRILPSLAKPSAMTPGAALFHIVAEAGYMFLGAGLHRITDIQVRIVATPVLLASFVAPRHFVGQ